MELSRDVLIAFIEEKALKPIDDLEDDTPLFSESVIDSFALVELILLIEQKCGIKVAPTEVALDNFDTIGRIMRFVGDRIESQGVST